MADGKEQFESFRSLLGKISLVCILWALISYGFWVWDVVFGGATHWTHIVHRDISQVKWPPLEIEKALFAHYGYWLGWMDWEPLVYVRHVTNPFFAFWDLALLRLIGLFQTALCYIVVVVFVICEGRVAYGEKVTEFGNRSGLRFHLFLRSLVVLFALAMLYTVIPFGDDLLGFTIPITVSMTVPVLGDIHFWVSNPINVFYLTGLWLGIGVYQLSSNFDRNM